MKIIKDRCCILSSKVEEIKPMLDLSPNLTQTHAPVSNSIGNVDSTMFLVNSEWSMIIKVKKVK